MINNTSNVDFQNKNVGYIPGKCNLGKEETDRRKLQTWIGMGTTILCIIVIQVFYLTQPWRLIVFIPLSYSILCFQQARQKFCVLFGINGVYNFTDKRKVVAIKEEESLEKDRKKAWQIIFTSTLIAFIIVIVYFYLPI